jgi:hypothetical protein
LLSTAFTSPPSSKATDSLHHFAFCPRILSCRISTNPRRHQEWRRIVGIRQQRVVAKAAGEASREHPRPGCHQEGAPIIFRWSAPHSPSSSSVRSHSPHVLPTVSPGRTRWVS